MFRGRGLPDLTDFCITRRQADQGNAHKALAKREGLPGHMPMGGRFFKKAWSNSETWDLGLAMNEGELFELSPPAAYVVVSLIKLAKLPSPFPY